MARTKRSIWVTAVTLAAIWAVAAQTAGSLHGAQVRPDEAQLAIELREVMRAGTSTRVQIELKAQGLYRPGVPTAGGADGAQMPKPRELDVQTRLIMHERIVPVGPDGLARPSDNVAPRRADAPIAADSLKVVRHVVQAAAAINGEVRPTATALRPEVALLVAEKRDRGWPIIVFSPAGPLSWSELELVQGVGDPLALADLLPERPVAVGDRWKVRNTAAKVMSGYDTITSSNLEATLESADASKARVRLKGRVEGSAFGGSGAIGCDGFATFDREAGRLEHLDLNRVETRQAGPVEAGLDMKSTLIVTRRAAEPPEALSDSALAAVPLALRRESELLQMTGPGGRSMMLTDRNWHIFWGDSRTAILKRLDGGRVIAQCNLMVGPQAGKGRHQDPAQFREDIRRGLKDRFVQFLGAGEIGGQADGGFRYRVGVQGREGDLDVIWYYYLLASPSGEQLLATFTLAADHLKTFGEGDLELIGSLRWLPPRAPSRR
jgi:hypothetical protein